MDMKTIDQERAEIAAAIMTLMTSEVEALVDDRLFGDIAQAEMKRRDLLRPNLESYGTVALARMLDNPEAAQIVTEILEARRDVRLRREELHRHANVIAIF